MYCETACPAPVGTPDLRGLSTRSLLFIHWYSHQECEAADRFNTQTQGTSRELTERLHEHKQNIYSTSAEAGFAVLQK